MECANYLFQLRSELRDLHVVETGEMDRADIKQGDIHHGARVRTLLDQRFAEGMFPEECVVVFHRFATPAHPENKGVGNVPGMQVEIVGRTVVGFEHSQVFGAEVRVRLSPGRIVNRKDKSA